MAALPDSLKVIIDDYNSKKEEAFLWIDKANFNYGDPQPNTNSNIARNTVILAVPKVASAELGSRFIWYDRIDLSQVIDIISVERDGSTRISDFIGQVASYYNTRFDASDYEDQDVFEHESEFTIVAKPGSLRFINSLRVNVVVPPPQILDQTVGDRATFSHPRIGSGEMIDVYQYYTSSLYAIYEHSDVMGLSVNVGSHGFMPNAVFSESFVWGVPGISSGGALTDTIAYKTNTQSEVDHILIGMPSITAGGELVDTISYKTLSQAEVDRALFGVATVGNGTCLVVISYVVHNKVESERISVGLVTIGNGTLS